MLAPLCKTPIIDRVLNGPVDDADRNHFAVSPADVLLCQIAADTERPKAIIDQETFDSVQRIRGNAKRYADGFGEAAPLTGLIYCADCGGKMYVHRTYNGKRTPQYTCSQYSKVPVGTRCPTQHRIAEKIVLSLVSDMLQAISDYAKSDRAAFIREVQEAQASQQDSDIRKKRRRLAAAQKRAGELERLVCKIYEDVCCKG